MSYNKCPFNLDIELWQLICNKMDFKSQNYLLSCDRNLWHQLRLYELPGKYGLHITDFIIGDDERYHYYTNINPNIKYICNNNITDEGLKYLVHVTLISLSFCNKITNEGLKYLANVTTINLSGCNKITDEGLKYLTNATKINISFCKSI